MTTLTEGIGERLATPLVAVAAVGILWSLATAILFFIGGAETDVRAPTAAADSEPRNGAAATAMSAARIAALNLFGVISDDTDRARLADAPETRLQLELHGVFLADIADQSSVIVAERNRDGRLYRIGDRLPGSAVLVEVFGDRIVLRRAGQLETLKFPDAAPGAVFDGNGDPRLNRAAARSSAAGATSASPNQTGSQRTRPATASGAPGGTSGGSGGLREALQAYSERLNVDPAGTLAELGVEPVTHGESGGYRLGSEIPSSTLAQVGLRPGDLVLSVNGQAVGNIQQDRSQLNAIVDAGSARLEIQRGDRRFFVTTRIQ